MDDNDDIMTTKTMMDTRVPGPFLACLMASCLLRVYYPLAALFTYGSLSCINYVYYGFGRRAGSFIKTDGIPIAFPPINSTRLMNQM